MTPSASARGRGATPAAARGYGRTPWSRALVDLVETDARTATGASDGRRITKARMYFRDHHVQGLRVSAGIVGASVRGSQLDPFDVTITVPTVDVGASVRSLRPDGHLDDVLAVARGEQPRTLGGLLLPGAATADCTCPDDAPRCIHVLAVTYEVAAQIDRSATVLLTLAGIDVTLLLDEMRKQTETQRSPAPGNEHHRDGRVPAVDYFEVSAALPALPSIPRMNPLTEFDGTDLRRALRASGVGPGEVAEAVDTLGDLYDMLRGD